MVMRELTGWLLVRQDSDVPTCAAVEEMLPFTASPALSILMLNDFINYLGQTDVTKVHWAQFMEVRGWHSYHEMLVCSMCVSPERGVYT